MSMPAPIQIIIGMAANAPDRTAVLEDIRMLTATPAPLLEQVERTLADGYALAIESERIRLRRQLEETAVTLGEGSGSHQVSQVAGLAQGVARTDSELTELRAALAGL